MLSNKDFANMIKSGTDLSSTGGGKARFDLKQVAQWDRQNKVTSEKKQQNGTKGRISQPKEDGDEIKGSINEGKSFLLAAGYRDRALERRKDESRGTANPSLASLQGLDSMDTGLNEEVIAKLDVEQSKFLGGDIEHTHLVKGLDFALLNKMRSQQEDDFQPRKPTNKFKKLSKLTTAVGFDHDDESDMDSGGEDDDGSAGEEGVSPQDIQTTTALGASLKQILFNGQNQFIWKDGNSLQGIDGGGGNRGEIGEEVGMTTKWQQLQQNYHTLNHLPNTTKSTSAVQNNINSMAQQFNHITHHKMGKGGEVLARTMYQFDINPTSEQDVPISILKSKKEAQHGVEYVHYALPQVLLQKLGDLFVESGKLISRQKRLKKEEERKKTAEALLKAQAVVQVHEQVVAKAGNINVAKKFDDDDIYGEDLLGDSKEYIPTVSTATVTTSMPKVKPSKRSIEGLNTIVIFTDDEDEEEEKGTQRTGELKGLFSNIRSSAAMPFVKPSTTSSSSSAAVSSADVMKPVRDLLSAQAQKERVQKDRQAVAASGKVNVVVETTDSAGKKLVHRDIFATTKDKVVNADSWLGQKAGDAFGLSGTYDNYFEDDDGFDSDEGGGGSGGKGGAAGKSTQPKKKPRVEE